jgi:hypothetical protein
MQPADGFAVLIGPSESAAKLLTKDEARRIAAEYRQAAGAFAQN